MPEIPVYTELASIYGLQGKPPSLLAAQLASFHVSLDQELSRCVWVRRFAHRLQPFIPCSNGSCLPPTEACAGYEVQRVLFLS